MTDTADVPEDRGDGGAGGGVQDLLTECCALAEQWMSRTGTPGAAIGVWLDGLVATRGLGVTSLVDPLPVTERTRFRLCSVTKPLVATLAVGMDREGLVGLDDPVGDLLEVPLADPAAAASLSLRHLLQHTSGLEGEWPVDLSVFGDHDGALQRLVAEFGVLRQFAPVGRHWGYCNPGYWLAAAALARAGEADFERLMIDRVLTPLGMSGAGFAASLPGQPLAAGHEAAYAGGPMVQLPPTPFPRARNGSGGLVADIDDLMAFAGLHLGAPSAVRPPGIDSSALLELARGTVPTGEPDEWQALGFQVIGYPLGELVKHSGGYPGYGTRIVLVPRLGLGLGILTNATGGGSLGVLLQEHLADRLLGRIDPPPRRFVEVPPASLARLRGSYALPESVPFTVEPGPDGLRFLAEDRSCSAADFEARALSDTTFVRSEGADPGVLVEFLPDAAGRPTVLRLDGWLGARMPAPSPIGPAGRHLERVPALRALREVATPALVIAEAAVQENLDRTLALTGSSDRWRPHLKTARSVWAAKVLLARGVRRCKVSTPSELRMAVEAGFRDVLLAYPAVGPLQWAVADLAAAHPESRISVLVDSSAALDTWRGRLSAFVDLDTGGHRTGVDVVDEQAVVRLVDDLRARGHRVAGLHSYDGHLADEPAEVRSLEVGRSLRDLAALSRRLAEAGTTVEELVVGSTHTYDLHLAAAAELDGLPHLTVGPGTLLYADIQALERSGGQGHTLAAGVLARVVSTGADTVTVDAGLTAVQVDAGRPHAVVLGHDGLTAGKPSQEHLVLEATTDHLPAVGALLVLVPRHVDTAIAQVGEIHVVAPDGTVHREPVAGRWHRHAG